MRNTNETTKVMGEKMMMGWTMLNATCPRIDSDNARCNTPLLRDHDRKEYCACCDAYIISDEEASAMRNTTPTPTTPATTTNTVEMKSEEVVSPSSVKVKNAPTNWMEMTDAEINAMNEWKPPTEEDKVEIKKANERRDKATKKIGEKLLQGWTMLNATCPKENCGIPLMGDKKDGHMWCLACDKRVVTPEEFKEMEEKRLKEINRSSAKESKRRKVEAATSKPVSKSIPAPLLPSTITSSSLLSKPSLASAALPNKYSEVVGAYHNVIDPTAEQNVKKRAIDALYKKMDVMSNRLSDPAGIDESIKVVKLIAECGVAIKHLQDL